MNNKINRKYLAKEWAGFIIILAALLLVPAVYAENIPHPADWVSDFAGVVSSEYRDKITSVIKELEEKTSAQIMVVTVNSIAPYDEKSYARMLFDSWKPGKKLKDNGVLVLLVVKERRWRIETGYGVEGILPDGVCGNIGRSYMIPYFKTGEYGKGLYYGVAAIASIIAKDAKVTLSVKPLENSAKPVSADWAFYLFLVLWVLLIFVPRFIYVINRTNSRGASGGGWTSGGFGGDGFGGGFGGGGFGGGGGGGGGGAGGGF